MFGQNREDVVFQVFCDPNKRVKVTSEFANTAEGLLHGLNDVEDELQEIADFLKVCIFKLLPSPQSEMAS